LLRNIPQKTEKTTSQLGEPHHCQIPRLHHSSFIITHEVVRWKLSEIPPYQKLQLIVNNTIVPAAMHSGGTIRHQKSTRFIGVSKEHPRDSPAA
jgi:hypothetical protein